MKLEDLPKVQQLKGKKEELEKAINGLNGVLNRMGPDAQQEAVVVAVAEHESNNVRVDAKFSRTVFELIVNELKAQLTQVTSELNSLL